MIFESVHPLAWFALGFALVGLTCWGVAWVNRYRYETRLQVRRDVRNRWSEVFREAALGNEVDQAPGLEVSRGIKGGEVLALPGGLRLGHHGVLPLGFIPF